MSRHILDNSAIRHCTSCQMCAAVCPHSAITIELDREGFYRPIVNEEKCVNCGLCQKVCYKFDTDIRPTQDLDSTELYAAAANDDALTREVTSGGIADLMAKALADRGYTCIGVRYDENKNRAEHCIAEDAAATDVFRGSKYIQAYSFPAFRQFVETGKDKRWAIFGTPCQIYAIHKYLSHRHLREQAVLIDLYCHGCPSLHVWTKYLREVSQLTGISDFKQVNFRSKAKGWGSFYVLEAKTLNGKVFKSTPQKDEFYELFFSDLVLNTACSDCQLRSTLEYTDIRLGDFWGKKYLANTRGVSAVSIVTKRGKELFDAIRNQITTTKHDYADLIPHQSYGKVYHPDSHLREQLFGSLSEPEQPLRTTINTLRKHQKIRNRLKRHAKAAAYYLPGYCVKWLKRWI